MFHILLYLSVKTLSFMQGLVPCFFVDNFHILLYNIYMKVIGSVLLPCSPLPNEVFNTCRHFQFINKASYELCNLFAIHRKPYFLFIILLTLCF